MKASKGKLLLADPFLRDLGFKRSVILLCDYDAVEGSVGYVLNKPLDVKFPDIVEDFPEYDGDIYYGGPVAPDTLHYIHTKGDILDDSNRICDGVWWGGDFTKMKVLLKSKILNPTNIKFYLGYSGWSSGQIEDELSYGSWIMEDMNANYLFGRDKDQLWSTVMRNKGNHFTVISKIPDIQYQN